LASTISDRPQFALSGLDVDVARHRIRAVPVFRDTTGYCLNEPRKDAACDVPKHPRRFHKVQNLKRPHPPFHPDTQIRVIPHIVHYFEFIQYKRILLTTYI
jgi:hypothetical protein